MSFLRFFLSRFDSIFGCLTQLNQEGKHLQAYLFATLIWGLPCFAVPFFAERPQGYNQQEHGLLAQQDRFASAHDESATHNPVQCS